MPCFRSCHSPDAPCFRASRCSHSFRSSSGCAPSRQSIGSAFPSSMFIASSICWNRAALSRSKSAIVALGLRVTIHPQPHASGYRRSALQSAWVCSSSATRPSNGNSNTQAVRIPGNGGMCEPTTQPRESNKVVSRDLPRHDRRAIGPYPDARRQPFIALSQHVDIGLCGRSQPPQHLGIAPSRNTPMPA